VTTRAALRSLIRQELNDAGGTPLWTDSLLNEWIAEAVRQYGRALPKEAATTLTTVADQAAYALPADTDRVLRVTLPEDVPWSPDLGSRRAYRSYRVFAGELALEPAPSTSGESIGVAYLARYAEPAADGDTLATPSADDDILLRLVVARALRWITLDEAKRQRFERQRGSSTAEAAALYEREARDLIHHRQRRIRPTALVSND
jgi:hypothetical protein